MRIPLHKSLKFRMPLVVLAGILPLISIAIFYATDRAAKTIRQEATENVELKTEMLTDSVLRWEESNIVALTNLSAQPDIISTIPTEQKPVLKALADKYKHFYLAMTIDKDGWNIARNDNSRLKYYGDRAYFQSALQGKEITYQAIISRTTGKPALMISTPILQNKSTIVGVAALGTDLEELSRQVGQLKFGKTGYVFIVNQFGKVLAHPNSALVAGEQLVDLSDFAPVKHALQVGDSQGEFSFQDDVDQEWLSWSKRLKNGWSVIVVQQKADLLSSQEEFKNLAFFIAIVAISGVSILIFILADRLITPISDLTFGAIAIANGQLDQKVNVKRQDELGILANSFNCMTSQLKTAFENLETRNAQLKNAKEIAEKSQATAELANKAKDRFLANISHELRTPLNGILGYTKLVLTDEELDSTHSEYLKVVEQSGIHLLNLINDILDISQTQLNKIELYPNKLELSTFLDRTSDLVIMLSKEKGLELKKEFNRLPGWVWADEKRLRQILINLLSNAIKFTNTGQITLRVSVIDWHPEADPLELEDINSLPRQKIRFEVIDTGVGITQSQLKKVFQPFEQVGDSKSKAEGTGLGLSISKRLVELMGGQLQVKSKFGLGSTFWFDITLPVLQTANKIEPKRFKTETLANAMVSKEVKSKILVVDDKQVNRDLLVAMLKPKGFEVFTANNGEHMLKIASQTKPDLILLDLFMPVKTGFTSAKELRQHSEFKDIPIIVVTASTITKEVSAYLDCDAVLHKPIDEKKLFTLVYQYLSKNTQKSLQDAI